MDGAVFGDSDALAGCQGRIDMYGQRAERGDCARVLCCAVRIGACNTTGVGVLDG